MGMRMTTIEVDQDTAVILRKLKEKAQTLGLTLSALLKPLTEEENGNRQEQPPRNEAMRAVLQRSAERMKDVPARGTTEDTLKMIRAARSGEMWGDEPAE